jgi:hypothetical protein
VEPKEESSKTCDLRRFRWDREAAKPFVRLGLIEIHHELQGAVPHGIHRVRPKDEMLVPARIIGSVRESILIGDLRRECAEGFANFPDFVDAAVEIDGTGVGAV